MLTILPVLSIIGTRSAFAKADTNSLKDVSSFKAGTDSKKNSFKKIDPSEKKKWLRI